MRILKHWQGFIYIHSRAVLQMEWGRGCNMEVLKVLGTQDSVMILQSMDGNLRPEELWVVC